MLMILFWRYPPVAPERGEPRPRVGDRQLRLPPIRPSPRVDRGRPRCGGEAVGEVERRAEVAGPERVAAVAVLLACRARLRRGVHREAARPLEPALVARTREELEQREAVACRAVAEAAALAQRAGGPGQLAARKQ